MIRPFNPVAALKAEHRDIISELNLLEKDLRTLGQGSADGKRWENLQNSIEFVVNRLQLHTQEEDEAFLPAMRKYSGLDAELQTVGEQDQYLREAFDKVQEQWQETLNMHRRGGDLPVSEWPFLVQDTLRLTGMLREHMNFEEEILFDYAARYLTDEQKEAIALQMLAIRYRQVPGGAQALTA